MSIGSINIEVRADFTTFAAQLRQLADTVSQLGNPVEPAPRVWSNFSEIPPEIEVEDKDGDRWESTNRTFGSTQQHIADRSEWAPFTEVLESE